MNWKCFSLNLSSFQMYRMTINLKTMCVCNCTYVFCNVTDPTAKHSIVVNNTFSLKLSMMHYPFQVFHPFYIWLPGTIFFLYKTLYLMKWWCEDFSLFFIIFLHFFHTFHSVEKWLLFPYCTQRVNIILNPIQYP